MLKEDITVSRGDGLSAQSACFFIQKASSFGCQIWIEDQGHRVNAKSLLGILSMDIAKGSNISLVADGSDEHDAIRTLCDFCQ